MIRRSQKAARAEIHPERIFGVALSSWPPEASEADWARTLEAPACTPAWLDDPERGVFMIALLGLGAELEVLGLGKEAGEEYASCPSTSG